MDRGHMAVGRCEERRAARLPKAWRSVGGDWLASSEQASEPRMAVTASMLAVAIAETSGARGIVPVAFGVAASCATFAGGLLGIRLAHRIVLILGLTAGIVLGVALFDLIPEAIGLATDGTSTRVMLAWVAGGLAGYMLFDRMLGGNPGVGRWRAHLGPATLTMHSLMDGLGIGLAFQVSPQIGGMIALAVLTHDVADGVNTVSLCLAVDRRSAAWGWLVVNGMAPLIGVLLGLAIHVPSRQMAPLMAVFAGVFLYIGACELIPRSHAVDPRARTTIASIAGIVLMFVVTVWAK